MQRGEFVAAHAVHAGAAIVVFGAKWNYGHVAGSTPSMVHANVMDDCGRVIDAEAMQAADAAEMRDCGHMAALCGGRRTPHAATP